MPPPGPTDHPQIFPGPPRPHRRPLYSTRQILHTGTDLLTERQQQRLDSLFVGDQHVEVEATWAVYQQMINAYRDPDRIQGRATMTALIEAVNTKVPAALTELPTLGRTLKRRAGQTVQRLPKPLGLSYG